MTDKFISIEGIARRYPGADGATIAVFENLWLSMARGEFGCVIGHSGCGKTTVLNILAGLDEPSEGVQWENILHMTALIEQRKAAGTALIVVEQNLAFAERIADHYLVMDQGRTVLAGARADIDRARLLVHLQV